MDTYIIDLLRRDIRIRQIRVHVVRLCICAAGTALVARLITILFLR